MIRKSYLLLCIYGISACFFTGTDAREAIINGHRTDIDVFPYQVSVQIRADDRMHHICGGGIIGHQFILTAACCFLTSNRRLISKHIFILAGTSNLKTPGPPAVNVRVQEIFFPSELSVVFQDGKKEGCTDDIAVLKLAGYLPFHAVNLKKLELPQNIYVTGKTRIAGFGINSNFLTAFSDNLRFAEAYVLPNYSCQHNSFPIQTNRNFCARAQSNSRSSAGVCFGDDGGPLVYNRTVIGILNKIPKSCDELSEPAVYTRVTYYETMIRNVMHHSSDPNMISFRT